MKRKLSSIVVGVALAAVAVRPLAAMAIDDPSSQLIPVSGQSAASTPYAGCTADDPQSHPGQNFPNSEVEPWLAANPTNPANLVVAYQQDRWSTGSARGIGISASADGGVTWVPTVLPGITKCAGGVYEGAGDPWVTFSPNGRLYSISLGSSLTQEFATAILVNTSDDGGRTWGPATTLIRDTDPALLNDKESITADPTDGRYVYAVWDRTRFPSDIRSQQRLAGRPRSFRSNMMFSRTTDGGMSWEPARPIVAADNNARLWTTGHQIVVLPNGDLVDILPCSTATRRRTARASQSFDRPTTGRRGARLSSSTRTPEPSRWSIPTMVNSSVPARLCPTSRSTRVLASCTRCGRTVASAATGTTESRRRSRWTGVSRGQLQSKRTERLE